MSRYATLIMALGVGFLLTPQTQAQPAADQAAEKHARAATITVTKLVIDDTKLELSYELYRLTLPFFPMHPRQDSY